MSNYLYHLVAKNFNLLNTVQPHLPSVFEPLPESALLFGEADNWEPSNVTVEETESETTLEAEKFTFDIEQLLEERYAFAQPVQRTQRQASGLSPATNLQTPDETSNPLSTDLTSTPAQHSQPISASTPYFVEEPNSELSPAWAFPESVVSEITTDNMSIAQDTELKISTVPPIPAVKLQAQSSTQQPKQSTEIDPVVSSRQSPAMVSWELVPTQRLPESEIISLATAQVTPTPNTEPLTPALVLETNTPLSSRVVDVSLTSAIATEINASFSNPIYKHKQLTPQSLPQQPLGINRVVLSFQSPLKPDLQLFSISKLTEPALIPLASQQRTFSLPSSDTTTLTTAIAKGNNAVLGNFAVEQLEEPTTQFLHNQSSGIHRAVSLKISPQEKPATETSHKQPIEINRVIGHSQSLQVASSELPSPQFQPKSVTIAPAANKVLCIADNKPLKPVSVVETNTPVSIPTIKQQEQPVVELQGLRSPVRALQSVRSLEKTRVVSSPQVPKQISLELSDHHTPEEAVVNTPDSIMVVPTTDKKPLTPALAVKTNTSALIPVIQQQQQPVGELQELRSLLTTPVVSSSPPSQKLISTEISTVQPQPESAVISPLANQVLSIVDNKPLTPALAVKTNTSASIPVIQQQQPVGELQELRSLLTTPVVSSSPQSQKLISTEISTVQPQPEPMAIEQSAGSSRAIAKSAAPSRGRVSIIDRMSSNPHNQPLTPAIAIQTHFTSPHSVAEPQGKLASEVQGIQRRFAHPGVSSTQLPLTDVSPEPSSLKTKSPTAAVVDDLPSSVTSQQPTQLNTHSNTIPTSGLRASTAVAYVQPQVSFSDSNLSDFPKREQRTANSKQGVLVGDLNPNQNLRRLEVGVSDSPIGNDEGIVSSRVDNLILPQNPTPNPYTYGGRENGNEVRSSYFKHLEESDIRPLSQSINDVTEKSLSVIAANSKEAQQRSLEDLETPPVVQVTIGRVEIRATPPAPPPSRPKPRPAPSVMSLDDYLRRRAQRR
ncbi:hypothetical protein [Nostoc sp. UHCC 0251]|uniref:hypothetical protein n=1 Tax=Nostoc sp. UHCC 0251 TaxID=3110240 RepID=UPI002B1F9BEE|nr:hypothetical protein [Nostoc sp. UHCC 0251]MEA5621543.1 hypothetical protein [Nostoc sp. UHCC 0251]